MSTKSKHKHRWHFAKEYGGMGTAQTSTIVFPYSYKFVCECGKTKVVEEKQ